MHSYHVLTIAGSQPGVEGAGPGVCSIADGRAKNTCEGVTGLGRGVRTGTNCSGGFDRRIFLAAFSFPF